MTQPSVYPLAKKARADKLTAQLDADIVQFFCVGELAPSKANLPEWKQIFRHAVPSYQPASSSNLDLLSDKPIQIGCSATPSEQEITVVPSSDVPLRWEFTLP